jgi:hypothetical protein
MRKLVLFATSSIILAATIPACAKPPVVSPGTPCMTAQAAAWKKAKDMCTAAAAQAGSPDPAETGEITVVYIQSRSSRAGALKALANDIRHDGPWRDCASALTAALYVCTWQGGTKAVYLNSKNPKTGSPRRSEAGAPPSAVHSRAVRLLESSRGSIPPNPVKKDGAPSLVGAPSIVGARSLVREPLRH